MKLVKEYINEVFTKDSDPIKDMNIGYKDYEDYVEKKLAETGDDPKDFWDWHNDLIIDMSPQDLLEFTMAILKHTPIEYQIECADDALSAYKEEKE